MKLHIIQHESFEAPAAILKWAESKNYIIKYTKLFLNESLPNEIDNFDLLIVMGGPQCPDTSTQECPHFDAKKEIAFIKKAIDAERAVLGICLGAQLVGEAMGAKYDHSPNKEIGVFEVTLTDAGKNDPCFSKFPPKFLVGHWHGDMPGIAETSEVLAVSAGCPRQIIRYKPNVYGFQCHFEFTKEAIEEMIKHCGWEMEKYKSYPYIQDAKTFKSHNFSEINEYLFQFLDFIESSVC